MNLSLYYVFIVDSEGIADIVAAAEGTVVVAGDIVADIVNTAVAAAQRQLVGAMRTILCK